VYKVVAHRHGKNQRRLTVSNGMINKVLKKLADTPVEMLGLVFDILERLCGSQGGEWAKKLAIDLNQELGGKKLNFLSQLNDWVALYLRHFGIAIDPYSLRVPAHRDGFDRLIVVACGLTVNKVYDACAKQFPYWRWTGDLDAMVTKNDRDPTSGTYAIWVRGGVEADKETRNLSADDLADRKIAGVTLLERLLLERAHFEETGNHLDLQNVTLCSGSRYSGGRVPLVYWRDDRLEVYWSSADRRNDYMGARAVVS
jgi:hypothetical protein